MQVFKASQAQAPHKISDGETNRVGRVNVLPWQDN
jgi:hypothetical protein